MQLINAASETEQDFEHALKLEKERKQGRNIPSSAKYPSSLFYMERAKYYEQLQQFYEIFPHENILVMTNEEFRKDNAAGFEKVLEFLGADPSFSPDFQTVHGSKQPRSQILNRIAHSAIIKKVLYKILGPSTFDRLGKAVRKIIFKKQPRQEMSQELRQSLEQDLLADVKKTGELLGRDLAYEWGMEKQNTNKLQGGN
jgi:hypothetical protein